MTRISGLVLLVALLLTACGRQAPAPVPDPAPEAGPRAVASTAPHAFDATAQAWVELVVATDDQAVKLMDMGSQKAADPDLKAFAAGHATARRAETKALKEILTANDVTYANYHSGHDMPGMPTEAELVALWEAPDFDVEFTRLARAHLTESETVARSGATSITHPAAKAAADAMVEDRAASLRALDALA